MTEQAPFDEDGRPFPTQFYVTCPHLVAAISRLEAAGGVERWTRAAARRRRRSRRSLADAQAEQRALRPELPAGIGGSTRDGQPQVPARARRVRARPARLRARRPDPRRAARSLARHLLYCMSGMDVELARHHWDDGDRRVQATRARRGALRRAARRGRGRSSPTSAAASARRSRSPSSPTRTTAPTTGRASCSTSASPTRCRTSRARSPTRPSTSTPAARPTTARESAVVLVVVLVVVVFAVGVAVGEALQRQSRPPAARRRSSARSTPLPLAPAATRNRDGHHSSTLRSRFRQRQLWLLLTHGWNGETALRRRAGLADARPGREVPRRRPVDDPQVERSGSRAGVLYARRTSSLPPRRPRALPRPLRAGQPHGGPIVLVVDDDDALA